MLKNGQLKILIATGVYPPDLGGPATYAAALRESFLALGGAVSVVTFGGDEQVGAKDVFFIPRSGNIFKRYFNFFRQASRQAKEADLIYALDLVSVGLPAVLAAGLNKKKVIFRTGGDFLWEKAFQSGWTELPLAAYYQSPKGIRERLLMDFCRWILRRMDLVIFSTEFQARLYEKYYEVLPAKSIILSNALPVVKINQVKERFKNSAIFAGRLIKVKNLERLIKAFSKINRASFSLLIFGEGPEKANLRQLIAKLGVGDRIKLMGAVSREELMEVIVSCRFFILPSVTEISPNLALECLSLRQPIILTKETGLDEALTGSLVKIDPMSVDDLTAKMNSLFDDTDLAAYKAKLRQINIPFREWRQVAAEHLAIFKKILS